MSEGRRPQHPGDLRPPLRQQRPPPRQHRRMRPQRRCLCKVEEINTKKKIQCFPINVTLFGPIKSVTLSNCHIILQFSGYGIPFQLKNCHIKQFVTLSSVTISGKHCSKISFIISHNSVQVLSTPRLQHAVHLRHGRVRDGD